MPAKQNEQVIPMRLLWRVGSAAAIGAAIPNLVLFWVGKGMFNIPFIIPMGGPAGPLTPLPWVIVFLFNVFSAFGATILLAILGKFSSRPFRTFWIFSVVVFLLSFLLPLTLPDSVATSTKISLSLMHFIAAPIIVGVLTTRGRKK